MNKHKYMGHLIWSWDCFGDVLLANVIIDNCDSRQPTWDRGYSLWLWIHTTPRFSVFFYICCCVLFHLISVFTFVPDESSTEPQHPGNYTRDHYNLHVFFRLIATSKSTRHAAKNEGKFLDHYFLGLKWLRKDFSLKIWR